MDIFLPDHKNKSQRITVSFTWDDNSLGHFNYIAPLFEEVGYTCTFFIVPGTSGFTNDFANGYSILHQKGFEIASHSYSHHFMTKLDPSEVINEFANAISAIKKLTGQYPISFAFPNHDFNQELLILARQYHLETRNTLHNSDRFSLKAHTTSQSMIDAVKISIERRRNLVFSGHSVYNHRSNFSEGYEPIPVIELIDFFKAFQELASQLEVKTFAQAALKEYLEFCAQEYPDDLMKQKNWMHKLSSFGITPENIFSFL